MNLKAYGLTPYWEAQHLCMNRPDSRLGRLIRYHGALCVVAMEDGEHTLPANIEADDGSSPAVGDWVLVGPDQSGTSLKLDAIMPRRSKISRKAAGRAVREQVMAANVDRVFVVTSLNRDLNLSRIERFLATVWQSGASPVIVLTKADLVDDPTAYIDQVEALAPGVDVHAVSVLSGMGMDGLRSYFQPGVTAILTGSSGVGKSTLVNALIGQDMLETGAIRQSDSKGRHTTTHRELLPIPGGAVIIDTPGLRELGLWVDGEAISQTFADIEAYADSCRFRDCSHQSEPGCAVTEAVDQGSLDPRRLDNYRRMQADVRRIAAREDGFAKAQEKQRVKNLHKSYKHHQNMKRKSKGI